MSERKTGKVLFLCTGNYYRSRFAEILFNHLAESQKLDYIADSRALKLSAGGGNVGPISAMTLMGLQCRNIPVPASLRTPIQATSSDFLQSDLVIALKEAEHRPMVDAQFPSESARVEYWHVHDLDQSHPDEALAEIERNVRDLVHRLQLTTDGDS